MNIFLPGSSCARSFLLLETIQWQQRNGLCGLSLARRAVWCIRALLVKVELEDGSGWSWEADYMIDGKSMHIVLIKLLVMNMSQNAFYTYASVFFSLAVISLDKRWYENKSKVSERLLATNPSVSLFSVATMKRSCFPLNCIQFRSKWFLLLDQSNAFFWVLFDFECKRDIQIRTS